MIHDIRNIHYYIHHKDVVTVSRRQKRGYFWPQCNMLHVIYVTDRKVGQVYISTRQ